MKRKLAYFLATPLLLGAMGFGLAQNAFAAYGTGTYGACTYQDQVCETAASSGTSSPNSTGAPNTGQERLSLFWPLALGIVGVCLVSFVVIRYLHRDRGAQT